jgi:uncharacterized Tic20 family protein
MQEANQTSSQSNPPGTPTPDDRMMAMFCHLSALIGFVIPFGNIIGPLIIWLIKKDQSPLVDQHGKEAINFQISMTIYIIASIILILVLIGIPLLVFLGLFELVVIVIAAVKANEGQLYKYPLSIRFLN